jgi:hypothetical protein
MKRKLKIYVWTGFCPDYTSGLAVALASDETEARELVTKTHGYEPYYWGTLEVHSISEPFAASVAGGG